MNLLDKERRIIELEIKLETFRSHCDYQTQEIEKIDRKIKQLNLEKRSADNKLSELSVSIMAAQARLCTLKNG